MGDLTEVYRDQNTPQARLVEAALRDHGLHPVVLQADLANMLGAGHLAVPARVMVPESEADEARAALILMEARFAEAPDQDEPENCPSCGAPWEPGFDVCWQCQSPIQPAAE